MPNLHAADLAALDFCSPTLRQDPRHQALKAKAQALMDFIDASPSAYQAVQQMEARLEKAGYQAYRFEDLQGLKEGSKGYYTKNGAALMAFRIGKNPLQTGFKVFGAHSDSPCLKLKPQSLMDSEGVLRLNVEVYGGATLNTFFDRPLTMAGMVALRSEDPFAPKLCLYDAKEPLLQLPNIAIHMNREVNEGVKIQRQQVVLPFLCTGERPANFRFPEDLLAAQLGCQAEDILDFELFITPIEKGQFCGMNDCFMSIGRLDNLAMCHAGIEALLAQDAKDVEGIQVLLFTDHEEVGSRSKQGADSLFPRDVLDAIAIALGATPFEERGLYDRSIMISADLAHAAHPGYPEKADPSHRPRVNAGPVIKYSATQRYATDAKAAAVFKALCAKASVPCQAFVNHSDMRGGSTIGPLSSSTLPMPTVDCGTAIWGMHSARETGGILDPYYMEEVLKAFFG